MLGICLLLAAPQSTYRKTVIKDAHNRTIGYCTTSVNKQGTVMKKTFKDTKGQTTGTLVSKKSGNKTAVHVYRDSKHQVVRKSYSSASKGARK